ncbi:hypothetical protein D3C80_1905620 [compost metagenome]
MRQSQRRALSQTVPICNQFEHRQVAQAIEPGRSRVVHDNKRGDQIQYRPVADCRNNLRWPFLDEIAMSHQSPFVLPQEVAIITGSKSRIMLLTAEVTLSTISLR